MQYLVRKGIFFRMSSMTVLQCIGSMFHRVVVKRDLSLARPGSDRGNRLVVSKSFIIFEMCLTDMNLYI